MSVVSRAGARAPAARKRAFLALTSIPGPSRFGPRPQSIGALVDAPGFPDFALVRPGDEFVADAPSESVQAQPVTFGADPSRDGGRVAEALEVAPRTIYRDVAALMAMRVPIDSAAGIGYIMRPGYDLPPLMFDREEVEAVAVGLQLLNRTGDQDLQAAARRVVAKIAGVLPELRAEELDDGRFVVSGFGTPAAANMGMLRSAVRGPRQPPPCPRLPRRAGAADRAHLLAACRHLLHRGHGAGGLVRAARRFPPLSRRPHRRLP